MSSRRHVLPLFLLTAAGCSEGGSGSGGPRCGADGVARGDETIVESQADADALEGCTRIEGSLVIRGPGIRSLAPLSSAVDIGRELQIREATSLTSLEGLGAVETVGWDLEVMGCDSLETLDGLSSHSYVGWGATVMSNASLTSIAALSTLTPGEGAEGTYGVLIRENPLLSSLDGLEFLGSGSPTIDLLVAECGALSDIDALSAIEELASLELRNDGAIESLEGLASLTSVGSITIEGLSVATLAGLNRLTTVAGQLAIRNDAALSDLSALSSLETVGELSVEGNPAIATLDDLPALRSVQVLTVLDDPGLHSLGSAGLGAGTLARLYLAGCPQLVDLGALSTIDSIDDQFTVADLDSLESLTALDGIASVGRWLTIIHNDLLPELDAEAWAASRGADIVKVDGNLGADPHVGTCPWTGDGACDEADGTGLCPAGSDEEDCRGGGD